MDDSGITRKSVLELVTDWGIRVEERPVAVREIIEGLKEGTIKEAFGMGTAATISHVALIGFDGTDYELKPVGEDALSKRILRELNQIRYGHKNDSYGWMKRPEELV